MDIIYAIEKVTGRGTIEGAQRIGKLYRIYIKNENARDKLCSEGFEFRDRHVSLYTRNPFTVREQADTVKIIIGGVPLSVAHEEFEKALIDLNVEMVSDIKFENYRDSNGKWTAYKTGRRFVYCKKPNLNLKPFTKIGLWNASIWYKEQVRPTKHDQNQQITGNDLVCSNDTSGVSAVVVPSSAPYNNNSEPNSVWDISGRDTVDTAHSVPSSGTASADSGLVDESTTTVSQTVPYSGKFTVLGKINNDCTAEQGIPTSPVTSEGKNSQTRSRKVNKLTDFIKDRRHRSQSTSSTKRKGLVSNRTPSPPAKNTKQRLPIKSASPLPIDWFNRLESDQLDSR